MQGAGNVSHNQAMDKATQEYHKFEVRTLSPVEQEYLRTIQLLNKKAKDKNREKPTKSINCYKTSRNDFLSLPTD